MVKGPAVKPDPGTPDRAKAARPPRAKPRVRKSEAAVPGIAIPPPATLHLSTIVWPAGRLIHRIHQDLYGALQFNPGLRGNARFSPVQDARGKPIPTLYGGASFACAAMESVFHDVPFAPGYKFYDKAKLAGQVHSQFDAGVDLVLVDLGSRALRKLGAQRSQLIDTEKDQYPLTRLWAEAIHAGFDEVQGLCWTSRQDDSAAAVVLFGDRIDPAILHQRAPTRSLTGDVLAYGELLLLAEQIGVDIVSGRS